MEPEPRTGSTLATPPAVRLKQFIEMCGRHPFATGLFALLSVFGLLFSFIAFGIDQAQSQDEAAETAQIQASLSRVEGAVRPAAAEPADFDPVKTIVEGGAFTKDNISFPRSHVGQPMGWIEANVPEHFSMYPFFPFTVTSDADKQFVQLAPYVVFQILRVEPVSRELAALYEGGRGGAEQLREFSAAIVPEPGLQFAPLIDGSGALRTDVDYLSLQPGESEEFFVYAHYAPGYVYTLRVGVHYRYKGRHGVHWVSPVLRAGVPHYELPLSANDGPYELGLHPDLSSPSLENLQVEALENRRAAEANRVFNPSQLADLDLAPTSPEQRAEAVLP